MPLGMTPILDSPIPAGKHVVVLLNSGAGVRETLKLQLQPGQLWSRSFTIQGGKLVANTGVNAGMLQAQPKTEPKPEPVAAVQPKKEDPPAPKPKPAEGVAVAPTAPPPQPKPEPKAPEPKPAATTPAPAESTGTRNVAGFVLEAQKTGGPQPQLPDAYKDSHPKSRLVVTYKICVNSAGRVYDVATVSGQGGVDGEVIEALKKWTYKPQSGNVCANKVLTFNIP